MTAPDVAVVARLERLEAKVDELLRLLRRRGDAAGAAPGPEPQRKLINGRWHSWMQGAGWLPEQPPARPRR